MPRRDKSLPKPRYIVARSYLHQQAEERARLVQPAVIKKKQPWVWSLIVLALLGLS